ncbi:hypothetical protein K456DRAFT_1749674 [Colletotrichum gloeosporioides 23]|nr:hypothetical protein K456DRAFT_1749674 [Colletotrichum gloeosporioides 23]
MSAAAQRGTLAPLPENHRLGLIVLTAFSRKRRRARRRNASAATAAAPQFPDLSLGLDAPCSGATGFERILELDRLAAEAQERPPDTNSQEADEDAEPQVRNPFPILVYNLLLADMMEALAYGLSSYWVAVDGIFAPSGVCWAQGWLGSTSNLAASLFLAVIAVSTFLTVGLGIKPPPWAVYTAIAGLWIFDFSINGAGVRVAEADPEVPGESFFMRANVWVETPQQQEGPRPSGYHPAFLAYPFVYIACSVPLVVGRITSLQGIDLGVPYFAFAGCVLALNGLFNSILWTTTILCSAPKDAHDTGLDRFAFMRTPIREFGNTVIISGPASRRVPLWEIAPGSSHKRWWWWQHGGQTGWGRTRSYASMHDTPESSGGSTDTDGRRDSSQQ